jgi:hypothetical protein
VFVAAEDENFVCLHAEPPVSRAAKMERAELCLHDRSKKCHIIVNNWRPGLGKSQAMFQPKALSLLE